MRLLSKNINVPDKEHVGIIEIVNEKIRVNMQLR